MVVILDTRHNVYGPFSDESSAKTWAGTKLRFQRYWIRSLTPVAP